MPEVPSDTPVLDTITGMTIVSLERTSLDDHAVILTRLAALAAIDAPMTSYLLHVGPGAESGVTADEVQGVLVAVAPIIGTARTLAAAEKVTEALGVAIVLMAEELAEEAEALAEEAGD
jgi:hypothetical protein